MSIFYLYLWILSSYNYLRLLTNFIILNPDIFVFRRYLSLILLPFSWVSFSTSLCMHVFCHLSLCPYFLPSAVHCSQVSFPKSLPCSFFSFKFQSMSHFVLLSTSRLLKHFAFRFSECVFLCVLFSYVLTLTNSLIPWRLPHFGMWRNAVWQQVHAKFSGNVCPDF